MKNLLKNLIIGSGVVSVFCAGIVSAATSHVSFNADTGMLSAAGSCSSKFVFVVIRRSSDGSIWGSSNPPCERGAYSYTVQVPESDRTGGTFIVDALDSASAAAAMNASGTPAAAQSVQFSAPAPAPAQPAAIDPSMSITLDTSSLAAAPDDQTFLDNVLSNMFGIASDVADAMSTFTTIFANTVKASLIAAVDLFSKNLTILPNGSVNVPKGADQLAGADWLAAGATDVFIPNKSVTSSSIIIVTPTSLTSAVLAVTQKADGSGFHVGTTQPAPSAISFDWLIVQTYAAAAPEVAEQTISVAPASNSAPIPTTASASETTPTMDATTTVDASTTASSTTAVSSSTSDSASSSTDANITVTPPDASSTTNSSPPAPSPSVSSSSSTDTSATSNPASTTQQ